jgi:hypothetical protein
MFVQVIRARVRDPEAARRQMERWEQELKPEAKGFLGSTGGIADDGAVVFVARFESEDAARRNSDRPEQGRWWEELSKAFDGDATFSETTNVDMVAGGGSDDAGFVQVIEGRAKDVERLRELLSQEEQWLRSHRPDLLGTFIAWHSDGTFTQVAYFTSEEEARAGERLSGVPEDAREQLEEWRALTDDVAYTDLRDPWLTSA